MQKRSSKVGDNPNSDRNPLAVWAITQTWSTAMVPEQVLHWLLTMISI